MERARAFLETANAAVKLALSAIVLLVVLALVTIPIAEMEKNAFGKMVRNFAILFKFDIQNIKAITEGGRDASQNLGDAAAIAPPDAARPKEQEAIAQVNDATVASARTAKAAGVPAPLAGSGVVFGADRTLVAARDELNAAGSVGLTAALYQRQGFYRSVALVDTVDAAQQALDALRAKYPQRAPYLVNLQKWCPVSRMERQDGVPVTVCD